MNISRPRPYSFLRDTYLWEIMHGMMVTMRHVLRNLRHWGQMPTIEYPEHKKIMPPGYRAQHRLTKREDGTVRCVACMMCATACPAECIHIIAGEHPNPEVEKYPLKFDIDLLECVFCGMCVEACPVDAIRMDSGKYTFVGFNRNDFIIHKEALLATEPLYPGGDPPR